MKKYVMISLVLLGSMLRAPLFSCELRKAKDQSQQDFHEGLLKEIIMAHVFEDSINDVPWITSKNFSPSGVAANYSFLYILFRALNDCNPLSIIEFGMGQTSKLTSQYANNKNTNPHLIIVEHDKKWINVFKNQILKENGNVTILNLPVETRTVQSFQVNAYKDLLENIGNTNFDLLVIDGPNGSSRFSRSGVLDLIPERLNKSFVIIMDDYNRVGEKDTAKEIFAKLTANNIPYGSTTYAGFKKQIVIYSKDFDFLYAL